MKLDRSWKKSIDKLARDMVCSIMNAELVEIYQRGDDLHDDRLSWLAEYGANIAVVQYSANDVKATGISYFKKQAKYHGVQYAKFLEEETRKDKEA